MGAHDGARPTPKQKGLGTHGGPLPTNTFSMQGLFTKGGLLSVGALVSLKCAEVETLYRRGLTFKLADMGILPIRAVWSWGPCVDGGLPCMDPPVVGRPPLRPLVHGGS